MSVTIKLPELDLPADYPLLVVDDRPWEPEELRRLAGRLLDGAELVDRGLWHVATTRSHVLEVYAASRSFRLSRTGATSELDVARERGLSADEAERVAWDFLADLRPDGGELEVVRVSESELLVSEAPDTEPKRLVLGTQVSLGFVVEGARLLGPGGKAQVTVDPSGEVASAYRMWRDVTVRDRVRALGVDELAERFGSSRTFAGLDDRTARVEVTSARAGLYSLPPTEVQDVLRPAVELRGTITTEHATVGFATHVSAVDTRALRLPRRQRSRVPVELVA